MDSRTRPRLYAAAIIAFLIAFAALLYAGAHADAATVELEPGDTIQTLDAIAADGSYVAPIGARVAIRNVDYRIVDLDDPARPVLYQGSDPSAAVLAANAATAAGKRIAFDTIGRAIVDPSP